MSNTSPLAKVGKIVAFDHLFLSRVRMACDLNGVHFDETLLIKLAYQVANDIEVDFDTDQVDSSAVTDETIIEKVLEIGVADSGDNGTE